MHICTYIYIYREREREKERVYRDMVWPDGDRCELYDWMTQRLPAGSTIITSQ